MDPSAAAPDTRKMPATATYVMRQKMQYVLSTNSDAYAR